MDKIATISCQTDKWYPHVISLTVLALLIPLYEFAVYPVVRRHFSWVKSHLKFLFGVLLQTTRVIALELMVLILKGRHSHLEETGYNVTLQCTFHEEQEASILMVNSKLMLITSALNFLPIAMLGIGGIEFICAQTPYSMRGLMFGASYGTMAVLYIIGYGISELLTSKIIPWGKGLVISCEFWYLLLNIVLLGFMGVVVAVFTRCYKKRKRENVLPNEQIFDERYYSY